MLSLSKKSVSGFPSLRKDGILPLDMETEGYRTVSEVAEGWGVTPRRVRDFCSAGRIPGAKTAGRSWLIPEDAMKPADGRSVRGGGMAKKGPETMEMQNRNMMNYCPDIKVFDATMNTATSGAMKARL